MRTLLRSNPLRLIVLVWFSAWLLMVMPGHKRGIVQLPDAAASAQTSCCEPKPPSCCETLPADCEEQDTPRDPAKHCAICFLKAHLTDSPAVTLYTPYLGELDELNFPVESSIANDLDAPARMRGRAPPAV